MSVQPKSLTLIRHGESEGNVVAKLKSDGVLISEDRYLNKGTHLFDLSPLGREQATFTGQYMSELHASFNTYMVSQYARAKQTFQLVFPNVKSFEVRSDLNEYDRGYDWLYPEKLEELFPTEAESKKLKGSSHHRSIGGENKLDLDLRIRSFLMWLSLYHADEDVVVVGHGTWIKSCYSILEQVRRPEWDIPNASVMIFKKSNCGKRLCVKDFVTPWKGKL